MTTPTNRKPPSKHHQPDKRSGDFCADWAVGTPTSRSAVPVAEARWVPYIAPFTGAAFLRDAKWETVINLRASYNQETEEMVARLTEDLGIERIGIMYQDDSYGRAGYHGVKFHQPSSPLGDGSGAPTYSKVFAQTLARLMHEDDSVVGISAAMLRARGW